MFATVSLAILFILVIAGGVLTLLKGLKNPIAVHGEARCLKSLKDIQDQSKYVGGSLIGVGVLGLILIGYMAFSGHHFPDHHGGDTGANFGFKFY